MMNYILKCLSSQHFVNITKASVNDTHIEHTLINCTKNYPTDVEGNEISFTPTPSRKLWQLYKELIFQHGKKPPRITVHNFDSIINNYFESKPLSTITSLTIYSKT